MVYSRRMPFVSYAQNGEDVLLWRALREVEVGFYIDVGAAHPTADSVTLAFYERGWHGINVDPDPDCVAALRKERPRDISLELAISAEAGQRPFYSFPGTGWSTLSGDVAGVHETHGHHANERVVETQTLAAICDNLVRGEIHFLKVDVEGSETQVIASGDFVRFRPWIIVIEATLPDSAQQVPRTWEPVLAAVGYRFAQFDGLNCYYVACEHAERLLPILAIPTNIFDDFVAVNNIYKAQMLADSGDRLPNIVSRAALEEAEDRAAAGEQRAIQAEADAQNAKRSLSDQAEKADIIERRLAEAEARAIDVELHVLRQESEIQLLRAEIAQPLLAMGTNNRISGQTGTASEPRSPGGQRIFFDATLMLRYGLQSAVGIVRVEHYVAEYLARDPAVVFDFINYDDQHNAYRVATEQEREFLYRVLFRRYEGGEDAREPSDSASKEPFAAPGDSFMGNETPTADFAPSGPRFLIGLSRKVRRLNPSHHWLLLRTRIRLAANLTPAGLTPYINRFALRHLPVKLEQSRARRAAVRLLRRLFLASTRISHRALRTMVNSLERLVAPDAPRVKQHGPEIAEPSPNYDFAPFQSGDVLLSMANTWDYMDYRYLVNLGRNTGVRLICVIYDVVGMELPFVTPGPAHLYHRHWVEIGHASERLIAISRFSAESYDRFIAQPNGINVPVDYALLPNFLKERAAEIGETMVNELDGRSFVVYCSTIEVRKNHILLLNVWEELRQRVAPEILPVLVLVGKWGWSADNAKLLIDRNWRLRPHLRVMNETSDAELIWLYRHARFTVFPSLTEGFGLAASESLSFGTPVVISHCPALLEATERLMPAFHPHDFMSWLHELERLILDDEYLDTLREKAKRFNGPAYEAFAARVRDAALAPTADCPLRPGQVSASGDSA
jgi:FkbM family methyltransferase